MIELIKYREDEGSQEARDKFIELLKKLKEAKQGVSKATGTNRISILMEVSGIFSIRINFDVYVDNSLTPINAKSPRTRKITR